MALCSIGPISAVLLLGITADSGKVNIQPSYDPAGRFRRGAGALASTTSGEVCFALGLIVLFFLILQVTCSKLPVRKVGQIGIGILYTFAGLVLFLSGCQCRVYADRVQAGNRTGVQPPGCTGRVQLYPRHGGRLAEPAVHG